MVTLTELTERRNPKTGTGPAASTDPAGPAAPRGSGPSTTVAASTASTASAASAASAEPAELPEPAAAAALTAPVPAAVQDRVPAKIRLDSVTKTFPIRDGGTFTALDDVALDVAPGEFLVVVGPSGCGKSTLLDLVAGLTRPTSGRILLDGSPVAGPALDRSVVFQQYALLPWRTAQRNVELALEARPRPERIGRRDRAARARRFLDLVGLTGFEDRYPHELSGGMRQRVAIARALVADPAVLLMDEPFAALDAQTRDGLQEELLRIWQQTGTTIVFITHGIDEAVYLGQRVAVMTSRPGRIKEVVDIRLGDRDTAADIRSSPEFAEHRHQVWSLLRDEVAAVREVIPVG